MALVSVMRSIGSKKVVLRLVLRLSSVPVGAAGQGCDGVTPILIRFIADSSPIHRRLVILSW